MTQSLKACSTRLLLLFLAAINLTAEEGKKKEAPPTSEPKSFVTKGTVTIGGNAVPYSAHATETHLRDGEGKATASIFSIAYFRDGVKDPAARPITFIFNGGPGSSAVWLHLGLLGPQRVVVPSDGGDAGAPPYRMTANDMSPLDETDLVFIDPVGTGFSHELGETEPESFWGLDEDAQSIAQFIRRFITDHGRWNSPKYIAGESYGTIRAAMLVRELQGAFAGVAINGVLLIAPACDMQTLMFSDGPDLPYITYLPTYAATAWYHDQLPQKPADLLPFLEEVRDFAIQEYSVALFKGDSLDETERNRIIDKLHQFTGLSKTYLRRANLRVNSTRFMKELLRDRGLTVGRLDSRYLSDETDDVGEFPDGDPTSSGIDGPYTSVINDYLRRVLKVEIDREYIILSLRANAAWQRPGSHMGLFAGYINVVPALTRGATQNKDFRLFVASGLYDLTTTFFSTEYMFNHSRIPRDRISMKHYQSGHMMYLHEPSLRKLSQDLRDFYKAGLR